MSWYQLLSIAKEAEDLRDNELAHPPRACPRDGEPLQQGPNGELFCKFDGYQYPRDGRAG
jgi:hypothetical protein